MSYVSDYFAYRQSLRLGVAVPSFYGLIMAAYRLADTTNAAKLRAAFPDVIADLQARYDAPGGVLVSDPDDIRARVLGGASS